MGRVTSWYRKPRGPSRPASGMSISHSSTTSDCMSGASSASINAWEPWAQDLEFDAVPGAKLIADRGQHLGPALAEQGTDSGAVRECRLGIGHGTLDAFPVDSFISMPSQSIPS